MMSHPLARHLTLAAVTVATAVLPVAAAAAAYATTPHSSGVQLPRSANASADPGGLATSSAGPSADLSARGRPAATRATRTRVARAQRAGADISGHSTDPLTLIGQVSQMLGLGKPPAQAGPGVAPSGGAGAASPLGTASQLGRGDRVSGVAGLDSDQLLHSGLVGSVLKPLAGQQINTSSLLDQPGSPGATRAARPAARSLLPNVGGGNAGNDLVSQLTQLVSQMTSQGPRPTGQVAPGLTPATLG